MILNVSFVRFLTSQPRRRGAYNAILFLSKQTAKTQKICIHSNHEHLGPDIVLPEIPRKQPIKLKWAIYVLFFIPPFPTSSMSGLFVINTNSLISRNFQSSTQFASLPNSLETSRTSHTISLFLEISLKFRKFLSCSLSGILFKIILIFSL